MRILLTFTINNDPTTEPIVFDWTNTCLPRKHDTINPIVVGMEKDSVKYLHVSSIVWTRNGAEILPIVNLSGSI